MQKAPGTMVWFDLTVPDATAVSQFYKEVVGWEIGTQPMGDYEDYYMKNPETGEGVTGVCNARGGNANIPPVWMIYLQVADIDASIAKVAAMGGKVVTPKRKAGEQGEFVLIQDPAGAHVMLWGDLTKK